MTSCRWLILFALYHQILSLPSRHEPPTRSLYQTVRTSISRSRGAPSGTPPKRLLSYVAVIRAANGSNTTGGASSSIKLCNYDMLANVSHVAIADRNFCPSLVGESDVCIVKATTCAIATTKQYEAIGVLKDYPKALTKLVMNSAKSLDLTMLSLPDHITSLTINGIVKLPGSGFTWPASLKTLNISNSSVYPTNLPSNLVSLAAENCNLNTIPSMPPTVKNLWLGGNALKNNDVKLLESRKLAVLSINNCQLSELTDLDLTSITHLFLLNNTNLTRIFNVQFSPELKDLNLKNMRITHWTMDGRTYAAINALEPRDSLSIPQVDDMSYLSQIVGFQYSNLTIDTRDEDCAGGKIKLLWADGKQNKDIFQDSHYRVCVLDGDSLSAVSIIGIVLGIIVLSGLGVFWWWRRRALSKEQETNITYELTQPTPIARKPSGPIDTLAHAIQALTPFRVENQYVNLKSQLGSGAFANVWHGKFNGLNVAVKCLHGHHVSDKAILSFIDEIKLLSVFDSPYIVKLIGVAWTKPSDLKCIMELMDGGDLKDYLDKYSSNEMPWDIKCEHIYSIIQALVYLHSMNIIHRDLKSRNVLLDSMKGTKLTDFGISKEDIQATMTIGIGTFRWMAPEVIQDRDYTVAADIYSFGCLLSEFDTHHVPYEDIKSKVSGLPLSDTAIMVRVTNGSIRPTFKSSCPVWIHQLAQSCLSTNPDDRPTAAMAAHMIRMQIANVEL